MERHYIQNLLKAGWQQGLKSLLTLLPNRCIVCRQNLSKCEQGICHVCLRSGLYQQAVCLGCGIEIAEPGESINRPFCGGCQSTQPLQVIAACSYHGGLGTWIAAIKYQRQFALLDALTSALAQNIQHINQQPWSSAPQAIVPVPLHANRLKHRGYNQAWLIAHALSQQLQLPLIDDALIRVKDTPAQAGLDGKQRRKNIAQAFQLQGDFPYQRIALVDDVVTTGTTVNEIAKCFHQQQIGVQIWCLARAEAPEIQS